MLDSRGVESMLTRAVEVYSVLNLRAEVGWDPPALEVDSVLDSRGVEVDLVLAPRAEIGSNPPAVEVVSVLNRNYHRHLSPNHHPPKSVQQSHSFAKESNFF